MDRFEELFATYARVADAVGIDPHRDVVRDLADACGWGRRDVDAPLLPSGVRHGVPYGISFVVGAGAPEMRLFVEPQVASQTGPPSLAAYRDASARVADDFIARQPGADVTSLRAVRDSFARVWYAVAFRPRGAPAYRAYLCLGNEDRERVVERTLAQLGVADSVERGAGDLPTMIGIDLHAAPRLKLYVLRPELLLDHPFARAMPEPEGDGRIAWLSCHFLEDASAPRVAWHYGAARHAPDDDDLACRLRSFMDEHGIDRSPYDRVRAAVPFRHHFVTYQEIAGAPRVTVYLLPEVARP